MSTAASHTLQTTTANPTRSAVRYVAHTARVLLGLVFFVTGLDGFLHFIPPPSGPMPEGAVALSAAMAASGYLFPLIKATELAVGALLLTNRFVPLALTVIAPVIVNIVAFNAFLFPSGLPIALVLAALQLYLAWSYRDAFRSILRARTVAGK